MVATETPDPRSQPPAPGARVDFDPWEATAELAPYRVAAIHPATPAIVELELTPLAETIVHRPGQYVLLEDDRGAIAPRSFSVANAPRPDGRLSLLVTRVAGGRTSAWVHESLAAGDEVHVSGPYGAFVDDPAGTAPALLLAAGSGLAPIRALLGAGLAAARRPAWTLVFSARTEADVIDRERFAAWQERDPRFRYVRTLTREEGAPPLGRIPERLEQLAGRLEGHALFVAGAPAFVVACAGAAEALGAARSHIHTEVFYTEPQPWSGGAPDVPGG